MDAELVALGVEHGDPVAFGFVELADVGCAKGHQLGSPGVEFGRVDVHVEVHPVLGRLRLGDLQEEHSGPHTVGVDDRERPVGIGLIDAYHFVEVAQSVKVLSDQGQFCCVFDFPRAFVQKGLNGKLVASWGSYSPASLAGSMPESLLRHIDQRFAAHPMRIQHPLPLRPSKYEDACNTLQEAIRTRAEACLSILGDERWDFFATAFSESHVAAHQFWQHRCQGLHDLAAGCAGGDGAVLRPELG